MISKNDLAKQFELLTLQQIKNHNDSILATNLSINKLSEKVNDLLDKLEESEKKYSRLVYMIQDSESRSNELIKEEKQISKDALAKIYVRFETIDRKNTKAWDTFEKFYDKIEDVRKEIISKDIRLFDLEKGLSELKNNLNKFPDFVSRRLEELQLVFTASTNKLKEQIKEKFKEVFNIIDKDKVDFSGAMRELEVVKKSDKISSNHIQNLYTQIDRIKVKK